MLSDLAVDEIRLKCLQCGERAGLVRTHESAVSDHVGGKDGSEAAFHLGSEISS